MTTKIICMKLTQPTYFQTIGKNKEHIKQSRNPRRIAPSNNYLFPKGYPLEDLIEDAKRFMQQDNTDKSLIYTEIHAEAEMLAEDALFYLDKAKQIANEIGSYLTEKVDVLSRDKLPIQSYTFSERTFGIDQSSIELRDSWQKERLVLRSDFMIDGVSNPHKMMFGFFKPSERTCDLAHLEEFYRAVSEVYQKLVG
jgi:hypothetical protein